MTQMFRTMIVPAALAEVGRAVAASLSPAGAGMFKSGLVPATGPGDAEPTHFISTGLIQEQFAALLDSGSASAMHSAAVFGAQVQGLPVTWALGDCAALLAASDVSSDSPFHALERVGLQLQQVPEEN